MRKPILVLLFTLLGVLSARAYDFIVDGIYYNRISGTDDQVEVTSGPEGYKYSGSVVIPATVTYSSNTYTVTAIGARAFWYCTDMTSVTIPEGVTSIGGFAFQYCTGLTSVTIPEGVTTIVAAAFSNCSGLTTVTIPANVTSIGTQAFYGCSGLTTVTIPESVTFIGNTAFYGCSGLTTVTIPENVTSIGYQAFYGCTSILNPLYNSKVFAYMPETYSGEYAIPSGIQSIAGGAFYGCSGLTSVTIPESVTEIGDQAFYGCTSILNPLYNSKVFVYMPETYSGEYAIPSGIQSIAGVAFYGCSGLTSVTIPESVTEIGYHAFYGCSGLTSVTIPKSVDTIWREAFYHCSGLTLIISLAKTPPFCNGAVFSVYDTLLVPRGSKEAYQTAEVWEEFTTIYESGFDGTGLITVQPNDTTMGRVTGDGEYELDEEITIEAVPNAGYHFVKWDDENTDNPRTLKVIADIALTAIFAQDDPTANENSNADNFGVYVQNRTIYLSEYRGSVQVYNVAGQCVYNGHATAIPIQQPGVYILRVADGRSRKIMVK